MSEPENTSQDQNPPPAATPPAAPPAAPAKTTRARLLRDWNGHKCGVWADFTAAELKAGVADGALDPKADEKAYKAALAAAEEAQK